MEKFLGVKLVSAEPMTKRKFCEYYGSIEGDFDEEIEDGYKIIEYFDYSYTANYKTLSQELIRELFEYKDGNLYWINIPIGFRGDLSKPAGYDSGNGYLKVGIFGDRYYVHRLIMKYHYGDIVDSYEIDHIDHNPSNNKLENLRLVTSQENSLNLRSKGVSYVKSRNKWISYLDIGGKRISLGRFDTEDEALSARKAKQDELFQIGQKFQLKWSPKDVFEKAYRKIKICSDVSLDIILNENKLKDFQKRVIVEANDLENKIIRLNTFIEINNDSIECIELDRLKQQLMAMQYYLTILVERIENFK